MTLGNIDNEKQTPERTTAEQLKNQSLFVEKLKYFYFSILLGEDTAENKTLLDFELSGQELLRKLDTRYFFYLDLKEIIPINEEEYYVFFKYEGEYFRYQFTFTESESGWQIEDISDMKKYSEKKYLQEIENLAGEN